MVHGIFLIFISISNLHVASLHSVLNVVVVVNSNNVFLFIFDCSEEFIIILSIYTPLHSMVRVGTLWVCFDLLGEF